MNIKNDYDVFVFCGGKCGGTTLANTFTKNGYKTLHMHGPDNLGMFNPKLKLEDDFYEILDSCASQKKIYIIDSYRNPIERKISAFFQQIHNKFEIYEKKSLFELTELFNTEYIDNENYHPINKLLDYYELPRFDKFDFENRYNIIKKDNKEFIKLRFNDIDSWDSILSKIIGKDIKLFPENITANKKSRDLYSSFKSIYKPSDSCVEQLVLNDQEFTIYNTLHEQEEYINKWGGNL